MTRYYYLAAKDEAHYDLVSESLYKAVRELAMIRATGPVKVSRGRFSASEIKGKMIEDDWVPMSEREK